MGKKHGGLNQVGKVRAQTPKVAKQVRTSKRVTGRAKKRKLFENRFNQRSEDQQKQKKPGYNSQKNQMKAKQVVAT